MNTAGATGIYSGLGSTELDSFGDFEPGLDFTDDNFDFDNADLGGDLIGGLPGSYDLSEHDIHEKRKHGDEQDGTDDDEDENGNHPKRRETHEGEKIPKKPGRKPLTNEPTTKRKAQNRAAQRAFRERKEQHLKDLETKVTELERSSEADKHENGVLKAQVERLQVELREYKKRLSLQNASTTGTSSPPQLNQQRRQNLNALNNAAFSFDFPKFGSLPQNQSWTQNTAPSRQQSTTSSYGTRSPSMDALQSQSPQSVLRHESSASSNSLAQSKSPAVLNQNSSNTVVPSAGYSTSNNMHGFASAMLPQMENDPLGDLFSPSLLKATNFDGPNFFIPTPPSVAVNESGSGGESTAGFQRAFQFNSTPSTTASPSASSTSQWNAQATNSSCGTSPEPVQDSPAIKEKGNDTFKDKTSNNGLPLQSNMSSAPTFFDTSNFTVPVSETFDPVLFGGYRDGGLDNGFGTNDFSSTLFGDPYSYSSFDMASPSNLFGILQSPQPAQSSMPTVPKQQTLPATSVKPSDKFLASLDKTSNGGDDDYGLTSTNDQTQSGKLISCNNIWTQLQSNSDFQDGKFDLDGLCSELRAKAKCSESGVMVPQDHVDAALRKLGDRSIKPGDIKMPKLMFEQESWDNVLKKFGNGST